MFFFLVTNIPKHESLWRLICIGAEKMDFQTPSGEILCKIPDMELWPGISTEMVKWTWLFPITEQMVTTPLILRCIMPAIPGLKIIHFSIYRPSVLNLYTATTPDHNITEPMKRSIPLQFLSGRKFFARGILKYWQGMKGIQV